MLVFVNREIKIPAKNSHSSFSCIAIISSLNEKERKRDKSRQWAIPFPGGYRSSIFQGLQKTEIEIFKIVQS